MEYLTVISKILFPSQRPSKTMHRIAVRSITQTANFSFCTVIPFSDSLSPTFPLLHRNSSNRTLTSLFNPNTIKRKITIILTIQNKTTTWPPLFLLDSL